MKSPQDESLGSDTRRKLLALGAAGAATGLLAACSSEDTSSGNPPGSPTPVGGSGGAGTGGAKATGGVTASPNGGTASPAGGTASPNGGTASPNGGTISASGGTTGGTASPAGGTASPNGGTPPVSGGGGAGGAPVVSGGTPNGGGGGTPSTPPSTGGWKEDNGKGCSIGMVPAFSSAVSNAKLPDPFKFLSGQRITKKEDWACLRADLNAALQASIYGPKMPPPDSLDASFSGGQLTINMKVGSKSGSFSVRITGGGTEAAPVPCLITCGGSSLPALSGVARIDMPNNMIAQESKTVGSGGLVHTLYGDAASKSGSLIGWAWGLSRIIDALEKVPAAGINWKRIAVTGCSRNGKGALAMGAFDERVALTLMQEGGSGGSAAWRISEAEKKAGQNIQESAEIVGEANWQGADFKQYANGQNAKLPADQHFAVALCAPRAVLLLENDIDWLGPVATYGGGIAGRAVFEALGIKDRCGVTVPKDHAHCSFPSTQQKYLDNFVTRFLKDGMADTSGVDELTTRSTTSKLGKFDQATWIDWDIPTLSGNLTWDPFAK